VLTESSKNGQCLHNAIDGEVIVILHDVIDGLSYFHFIIDE